MNKRQRLVLRYKWRFTRWWLYRVMAFHKEALDYFAAVEENRFGIIRHPMCRCVIKPFSEE